MLKLAAKPFGIIGAPAQRGSMVRLGKNEATVALAYTGSNQTLAAPFGRDRARAKLWGAGGGARAANGTQTAGSGGFTTGILPMTAASLIAVVGQGGDSTVDFVIGGGGGYTGLFASSVVQGNAKAIAGGGGGTALNVNGGEGGGSSPGNGQTNAGGAGVGNAGAALQGGDGAGTSFGSSPAFGGGGRGKYVLLSYGNGGGGGGYQGGTGGTETGPNGEAAGGGGSGYAGGLISGTTTMGSGGTPPLTTDVDYVAGVGVGGTQSSSTGGNGRIVALFG